MSSETILNKNRQSLFRIENVRSSVMGRLKEKEILDSQIPIINKLPYDISWYENKYDIPRYRKMIDKLCKRRNMQFTMDDIRKLFP